MRIIGINNTQVSFSSRKQENGRKTFQTVYQDKKASFDRGVAHLDNGAPYSGILYHQDSSGNQWQFVCKDGRIIQSNKNREPYKLYKPLSFPTLISEHTFQDGTKIVDDQFYNSTGLRGFQIFHNGTTTEIVQNQNAKYKNEPRIIVRKTSTDDKTVSTKILTREDGEEKFEFKSLEEAREYFQSEYGIDATFSNLIQAHITKDAVDDFAELNINNLGKKVFEGLTILPDKTCKQDPASANISIIYNWENNKTYEKFRKLFIKDKSFKEKVSFLLKNPPTVAKYEDFQLLLNENYNWENTSRARMKLISDNLAYSTMKGVIHHELGHILHGINAPHEYTVLTLPDTKEKAEIRKEVSKYAETSGSEFVAEYIAGRMAGKTYSQRVNDLYREYKGPEIFGDK